MKKTMKIGIGIATIATVVLVVAFAYFYTYTSQRGELYFVDFKWSDNYPLLGSPYVHIEGNVFNSGERTAGDVQLIIRIYDSQDHLLETKTMDLGDIPPKTYRSVDITINYSGDADTVEAELKWKPYA